MLQVGCGGDCSPSIDVVKTFFYIFYLRYFNVFLNRSMHFSAKRGIDSNPVCLSVRYIRDPWFMFSENNIMTN